jgi:hypothetical protein
LGEPRFGVGIKACHPFDQTRLVELIEQRQAAVVDRDKT